MSEKEKEEMNTGVEVDTAAPAVEWRIVVEQDDYPESPGSWDQLLELVPGAAWMKDWTHVSPDVPECGFDGCFLYASGHDIALDDAEEWEYQDVAPHEYQPARDVAALVVYDGRGPYATLREVDHSRWLEVRELPSYARWNVEACWLRVRADELEWWERDEPWSSYPDDSPITAEEGRRRAIAATLEEWRQYLEGEVYFVAVESRKIGACECCGKAFDWEGDALGGVYGSEGVRDAIWQLAPEGVLSTESEIQDALDRGGSDFYLPPVRK